MNDCEKTMKLSDYKITAIPIALYSYLIFISYGRFKEYTASGNYFFRWINAVFIAFLVILIIHQLIYARSMHRDKSDDN